MGPEGGKQHSSLMVLSLAVSSPARGLALIYIASGLRSWRRKLVELSPLREDSGSPPWEALLWAIMIRAYSRTHHGADHFPPSERDRGVVGEWSGSGLLVVRGSALQSAHTIPFPRSHIHTTMRTHFLFSPTIDEGSMLRSVRKSCIHVSTASSVYIALFLSLTQTGCDPAPWSPLPHRADSFSLWVSSE